MRRDRSERTAVRDGFMSYEFQNREVFGLESKAVQSSKLTRGGDDVQTLTPLAAVPAYFRTGVSWIALEAVRPVYVEYRGLAGNPDEPMG